jgi:hypothetical protein
MSSPIMIDTVRQLALALPEVTEGVCFGTPAFYVRKKLLVRLREDGDTLAIKADYAEREFWMLAKPETFFLTDHYVGYPMLLIRLSTVQHADLQTLLSQAWRMIAPKRLIKSVDMVAE